MVKSKNTKHSFIMSALSIIICVSMLIGSTYAWFTSSVTTGSDIIKSGTLKVDLVDAAGNSLVGQSIQFQKAAAGASEAILWEPGCTYNLQEVYVKNIGNLALKYKIAIRNIDGDQKLLEVIDWKTTVGGAETALDGYTGSLSAGEQSNAIVISGHMQEAAGNDYQDLQANGLSIIVIATQDTVEYDSIDNQYDADATYSAPVATANGLIEATERGMKGIELTGNISIDKKVVLNANTTFDGAGNTLTSSATATGDNNPNIILETKGGTIKNLNVVADIPANATTNTPRALYLKDMTSDVYVANSTFKAGYALNTGSANPNYGLYADNCTFWGWSSWSNLKEAVFTNCTFAGERDSDYVPGDTFVSEARVRPYVDSTFTGCKFETDVRIDAGTTGLTLTFTNCEYNGAPLTAANFQNLAARTDAETFANLKACTVIVDGVTVTWN